MTSLRRHVRLLAIAWMLVQAASLTAFVPRDCCASHRPAASAAADCHQPAPKAVHCPMRGADGAPCPMHRDTPATEDDQGHPGAGDCAMRATCEGPSIFAVFRYPGILPATPPEPTSITAIVAVPPLHEHPFSRTRPPDPRPPRA